VHVALTFAFGVNTVQGQIRIERAQMNEVGTVSSYTPYGKPHPISYQGMNAERLSVAFDAPEIRGIYKVVFESRDGVRLGADDLFVQEPA
jgi:hypothetical protein